MRRNPLKLAVNEVVEVPLAAIGQNAYVSLIHRRGTMLYVPCQLAFRINEDVAGPEIAFDLEDRQTDLDIDSTSVSGRLFEDDVSEIALAQFERCSQQQDVKVALNVRLCAAGPTIGQATYECSKIDFSHLGIVERCRDCNETSRPGC